MDKDHICLLIVCEFSQGINHEISSTNFFPKKRILQKKLVDEIFHFFWIFFQENAINQKILQNVTPWIPS